MSNETTPAKGAQKDAFKPLIILFSGFMYLYMAGALFCGFILQMIAGILLFPFLIHSPWLRLQVFGYCVRVPCACAGGLLNPFWSVKLIRKPRPDYRPKKTLIMCNHQSAADPWVVCKALMPFESKYVYKSDLKKLPFAGWAIGLSGDLAVYFTKEKGGWQVEKGCTQALMESVRNLFSHDMPLVVFPEGTRSRTGGIQPFRDGFFRFALEEKCDILPMACHGTKNLWPMSSRLLNPGNVDVAIGDPIEVSKLPEGTTIEQLKAKVHGTMCNLLALSENYNPVTEAPIEKAAESRGLGIGGKIIPQQKD